MTCAVITDQYFKTKYNQRPSYKAYQCQNLRTHQMHREYRLLARSKSQVLFPIAFKTSQILQNYTHFGKNTFEIKLQPHAFII